MVETLALSAAGLPYFLLYLAASFVLVGLFILLYVQVTPQREIMLLRQGNAAAAVSFGGAVIGFIIPLSQSVAQSFNLLDMALWSLVALVVQLALFFLANLLVQDAGRKITEGDLGTAGFLAITAVGGGMLNAACMTYG